MKNKIFSGRAPSAREKASIELTNLNVKLRRAGLEPVRPGGSSLAQFQAAQERGEEALEQKKQEEEKRKREEEEKRKREEEEKRKREEEEKRKREEEEKRKREEEERRSERLARYREFMKLGGGMQALYTILTSAEAAALRVFDSGDQLSIGEMFLSNPDFESIEDAANAYYAQKENAFDEMAAGDYDADFSGVPFF